MKNIFCEWNGKVCFDRRKFFYVKHLASLNCFCEGVLSFCISFVSFTLCVIASSLVSPKQECAGDNVLFVLT